jgi:hypothetical protein
MPRISCSAHSCVYNTDNCCSLTNVNVGGTGAKKACDTCCDSFVEMDKKAENNCADCACSFSEIDCAAKKCVYNKEGACSAATIQVSGVGAVDCNQTECDTFRK